MAAFGGKKGGKGPSISVPHKAGGKSPSGKVGSGNSKPSGHVGAKKPGSTGAGGKTPR